MTEPSLPTNDLAELQAYLARAALGPGLPPELEGSRLAVYRRLVQGALNEAIVSILPRTAARLGEVFWREVELFYAERMPQTHYLRDVPLDFVEWCAGRWPGLDDVPGYALDLARHEAVAVEVGAALDGASRPAVGELSLGRPVVFAEATRVMRYRHAVHLLRDDPDDRSLPDERASAVLVYRDAEHDLRYLDLSPAAASLLDRLLRGVTLQQAIAEGAVEAGVALDDSLLRGTATLLADLAERGALLGGACDEASG